MTIVAILGAGSGGLAATAELVAGGHEVRLWNRSATTLEPVRRQGCVRYTGVLGCGSARPSLVTTSLAEALRGAEVAVVTLPGVVHARLFADLADAGWDRPTVLHPGHTGGALHLRAVFLGAARAVPPVAELSTLMYVARNADGVVDVTGRADVVRAGALPGGEDALAFAVQLFRGATAVDDVLCSSLSNVNVVLHPPGAVLGASWVEATGGAFTFYVEGMTSGVGRVMDALDGERRAIAHAFGHELPTLAEEMAAVGTVRHADVALPVDQAVRGGAANARIAAPSSLEHRYYREDLPFGLVPLLALADVVDVRAPVAAALLRLGGVAMNGDPLAIGLTAERLGIAGMTRTDLLGVVCGVEAA